MLAAKFHDDLFYNNAYYSKLGKSVAVVAGCVRILIERLYFGGTLQVV